jgi:hypothetical protein
MNIFLPFKIVEKNQLDSLKAQKREGVDQEVEAHEIKKLIGDVYSL